MNILIINPPIRVHDKPRHIPHGLAILANIIRKKFPKINIRFIDWNAHRYSDEKMKSLIAEEHFDYVLMGGLIPVYKTFIKLSKWLREINKHCIILAGGSAAMSVPELLLKNSEVDIICTGEGELTVPNIISVLLDDKRAIYEIKGIAYKDYEGSIGFTQPEEFITDLDTQSALPAYDMLPMDIYLKNPIVGMGRDIDFISSRGCPFKCTFCYQPWGRSFRAHSVDFITDAVQHLKNKYAVDFISFQDDEFMVKKKRVFDFCEQRNKLFPEIRWSATGRANIVNEEIVKTVRGGGCTSISYGFESGSLRMLKSMNKSLSLGDMENATRLNRKYGFPVPVSFIIGMPGETRESCQETVDFVIKNNLHLNSLMFATPYPGTPIFDYALESGKLKKESLHDFLLSLGDARDFVINLTDDFTDDELVKQRDSMMKETLSKYVPPSQKEIEVKIKSLYGHLANEYFNMSEEDKIHKSKHGAINLF